MPRVLWSSLSPHPAANKTQTLSGSSCSSSPLLWGCASIMALPAPDAAFSRCKELCKQLELGQLEAEGRWHSSGASLHAQRYGSTNEAARNRGQGQERKGTPVGWEPSKGWRKREGRREAGGRAKLRLFFGWLAAKLETTCRGRLMVLVKVEPPGRPQGPAPWQEGCQGRDTRRDSSGGCGTATI